MQKQIRKIENTNLFLSSLIESFAKSVIKILEPNEELQKEKFKEFHTTIGKEFSNLTGIDLESNISIGEMHLTKYSRDCEPIIYGLEKKEKV